MLPYFSEDILRQTKPIQQRAVSDRVQDDMIIGAGKQYVRQESFTAEGFASEWKRLTGQSIERLADRHVPGPQAGCVHGEHWT